jgi:hypothetical protein
MKTAKKVKPESKILFNKETILKLKTVIENRLYDHLDDPNLAMDHGLVLGLACILMGREERMIELLIKEYLSENKNTRKEK